MGLRNSELLETFHFETLADLRNWLNQFKDIDLDAVHPEGGDNFVLGWHEETLSDGSTVNNAFIETA